MSLDRPDLSNLTPDVVAYIQYLEAEIERLSATKQRVSPAGEVNLPPLAPDEAPNAHNLFSMSQAGWLKRTARYLYSRQRRGGMGIFDIDLPEKDAPSLLAMANNDDHLVVITNQARTFRLRVGRLAQADIRSKGENLREMIPLHDDEYVSVVLSDEGGSYLSILTERGHVRQFRANYFGDNLRPGLVLFDTKQLGTPSAACWSDGAGDVFIATRSGKAIRFAAKLIPVRGCLGIRLSPDDVAVSINTIDEQSQVFLIGADGKGTIRLMSGFSANKAPGAGGKIAMKTDALVGSVTVSDQDDIFLISRLSKMIRFQAIEVPPKEGTVQGVNCMALRADEVVAVYSAKIDTA